MKIAIQGHPTRGKEVIEILESLGGINNAFLTGITNFWYFIDSDGHIKNDYQNVLIHAGFKTYTLEEFEEEFPFKIGDKVIDHERDVAIITGFAYIEEKLGYSLQYKNGRGTATPGILKPYKEMKKERNITLTLDKAKEWYKKGGELKEIALQAYFEEELTKVGLPKSWTEFCKNYPVKKGECILESADRISVVPCDYDGRVNKNWIPSKQSAEAHLALIQLEQLRNCWLNGWESDWNDDQQAKYCIVYSQEFKIHMLYETRHFLSFPTIEMAKEFLKCFRDLIEKAGDLI